MSTASKTLQINMFRLLIIALACVITDGNKLPDVDQDYSASRLPRESQGTGSPEFQFDAIVDMLDRIKVIMDVIDGYVENYQKCGLSSCSGNNHYESTADIVKGTCAQTEWHRQLTPLTIDLSPLIVDGWKMEIEFSFVENNSRVAFSLCSEKNVKCEFYMEVGLDDSEMVVKCMINSTHQMRGEAGIYYSMNRNYPNHIKLETENFGVMVFVNDTLLYVFDHRCSLLIKQATSFMIEGEAYVQFLKLINP